MKIKLLFIASLILAVPFWGWAAETATDEILQRIAEFEAENTLNNIGLQEKVNRLELEKKQLEYEQAIEKMKLGEVAAPQDGSFTIKDDFQILQRILSEKSLASMAAEIGEHIRASCNQKCLIITNNVEDIRKKIPVCNDIIKKVNDLEEKIGTLSSDNSPKIPQQLNKLALHRLESLKSGIIDLGNLFANVLSTKRTRTGSLFIAPPNWFEISKIAITNKIGLKKTLSENGLEQLFITLEKKLETCSERLKGKIGQFDIEIASIQKEIYIASYALDLANRKVQILRKKEIFNEEIEPAFNRFCKANGDLKECMNRNRDVILLAKCNDNLKTLKEQIASESPDLLIAAFALSKDPKNAIDLSKIKILEIFPPTLGGYIDTSTNSFKSTKVRETGGGKLNFTLYDYQFNPEIAGFVAFTNIQRNLKSIKIESIVSTRK